MLKHKMIKVIAKIMGLIALGVMAFTMIISYVPQVEGWLVDTLNTSIENIRMFTASGSIGMGLLGAYFSFTKKYDNELQTMDKTLANAIEKNIVNKDEIQATFTNDMRELKSDLKIMFINEQEKAKEIAKQEKQALVDEVKALKVLLASVLKDNKETFVNGTAEAFQAELDKGE